MAGAGGGGGGGDELKLLGSLASPFALRVKLTLSFKGLSYEYIAEDLQSKSNLLLSSNPVHKKVPVLIHNGKPICESQIIVQYIEEAFESTGPSLLPADPYERGNVLLLASGPPMSTTRYAMQRDASCLLAYVSLPRYDTDCVPCRCSSCPRGCSHSGARRRRRRRRAEADACGGGPTGGSLQGVLQG